MFLHRAAAAPALCFVLCGCAGNGEGLDQSGRPDEGGDAPLTAEFESIQDNVFTPICMACHAGAAAPLGLRLDEGVSFAMLVNAPSVEVPAVLRVAPGDPDASYLIAKLEGTADVGERMPLGGPALPRADIDVIRQWILEGAQPPSADLASRKPVTLTAVPPAAKEDLTTREMQLVVAADGELDATLLTRNAIHLLRSGGDDRFGDRNDLPIAEFEIEIRNLAPTVFVVHVPAREVVADRYRLLVSGSGAAPLADRNARAIDGDGDGVDGGDYRLDFDVETER